MNAPQDHGTYEGQLAGRAADLLPGIGAEERLELLAAMDEGDMRTSLAWLVSYAPQTFDFALVRDRAMTERLLERLDEADDDEDEPQPYCTSCGATVGIFIGHGPDWHHYRGNGTAESPNELYDAGHAPVVGWRGESAPDPGPDYCAGCSHLVSEHNVGATRACMWADCRCLGFRPAVTR